MRRRIFGIDFSGAQDAGQLIWVAFGVAMDDRMQILNTHRASSLPGSGRDRDQGLNALRFIAAQTNAAVGLDFPFGLPRALVAYPKWGDFVASFADDYATPEIFRRALLRKAGGLESRRTTDHQTRTPFSPYNLRVHKQTFHGLRDVIGPLVKSGRVSVLPMQQAHPNQPWIFEVCPASTLRTIDLYRPYKGHTPECIQMRSKILEVFETNGVEIAEEAQASAVRGSGGNALDSIISAVATRRASFRVHNGERITSEDFLLEGYVWV